MTKQSNHHPQLFTKTQNITTDQTDSLHQRSIIEQVDISVIEIVNILYWYESLTLRNVIFNNHFNFFKLHYFFILSLR